MTVIAATAAVSPVSPAPAVGGKDVAEGFDAILAVATAGEAPATPAASGQSKAQAADQSQSSAAADEEAEEALAAGQTDAAALAAATLVAAMVPPTQQTFVAAPQAEAEVVESSVPALAAAPTDLPLTSASPDDAVLAAANLAEDASAVAEVPDITLTPPVAAAAAAVPPVAAPPVAAPPIAAPPIEPLVAAGAPLLAEPHPIADPKAVALQAAPDAAGLDLPPEAVLSTPVAAADLGLDAIAVAQTAKSQATAAQANVPQAATTVASPIAPAAPLSVAPVDALLAPVMATPVAEAPAPAPAAQAAVQASAQAPAEPAIKLAMSTVQTVEVEAPAPVDENPVKIAGVAVSGVANPSGGNPSGANLGDTGQHDSKSSAEAAAMVGAEAVETAEAPTLTPSSTSAAPLAAETQVLAPARAETRGSPETVAQLSAEILRKLDAQTTRFDVALTPDGLGTVDVRIEIGRNGDLTASMAFDTAQAAAELRSKSHELRQALSQAGFTVADNALRFDVSSQGGQNGQNGFFNFNGGDDGRRAWSGKAFQAAQTDEASILSVSDLLPGLRMAPDSGLDIRI